MWIVILAWAGTMLAAETLSDTVISLEMRGSAEVATPQYSQARAQTVRMFAAIGLPVEWCQRARACRNWDERIVVTLAAVAPRQLSAEAHAFEGRTIRLYRDRMPAASAGWIAHVMVHEITHLLQACDHHSPSGVMKARWDARDHAAMKMGALAFTADDLDLVRTGLQRRRNLRRPLDLSGANEAGLLLGKDLQARVQVTGASSITATSSNPALVRISRSPVVAGQQTAPPAASPDFWIQGLDHSGEAVVEFSAPSTPTLRLPIRLTQSGFTLRSSAGTDTVRTVVGSFANLDLTVVPLQDGLPVPFLDPQSLRAGVTPIPITVANQDPAIGTVEVGVFQPGLARLPVLFRPLTAGSTTLSLQTPAGFFETAQRSVTAVVSGGN